MCGFSKKSNEMLRLSSLSPPARGVNFQCSHPPSSPLVYSSSVLAEAQSAERRKEIWKSDAQLFWALRSPSRRIGFCRLVLSLQINDSPSIIKAFFRILPNSNPDSELLHISWLGVRDNFICLVQIGLSENSLMCAERYGCLLVRGRSSICLDGWSQAQEAGWPAPR